MAESGMTIAEMADLLWPESKPHARRVLIARWLTAPVVTIRLDQLKALRDHFGTTNINNLINFDDETNETEQ
jgi:hypothetical protein